MASKLFFNGQIYSTPVTVSSVNDTAFAPTAPTTGTVLAIVGTCDGGQPNKALTFTDPNAADAVLLNGPLLDAVKKAFYPSTVTGAPNKVIAVRVGQSTQASLTLKDSTGSPSIVVLSNQYGLPANLDKVKVEAGSVRGLRISSEFGSTYYSQDNIYLSAFTIQYAGLLASATMAITNSSVILSAPAGTVVATIDLTVLKTVNQLTDRISAVAGFTASFTTGSDQAPVLNALDSTAAVDVMTAPVVATANLQAAINWINGAGQGIVTASRPVGAGLPPVFVPWTYLSGATSPATVISDWIAAYMVLQSQDVQALVSLTGDPAIHAAADAHAAFMSTVGRNERHSFVGPDLGTTMAEAMVLASDLDSARTVFCWPGYLDWDSSGNLTLYPSWMTASLVAAGFAGINPGQTMTNQQVRIQGMETTVNIPTDSDPLIQGGVLTLQAAKAGFKVVRAITTWLTDDKFDKVEVSCGIATDYVMRSVRDSVDPMRGGDVGPIALARCISQTETCLRLLAVPPPIGPGVIVGDANSPAYQNITATLVGDTLLPAFECSPVIPLNFIAISAAIVPYSGTASA